MGFTIFLSLFLLLNDFVDYSIYPVEENIF